jgi:hypothetical protein
MDPARISLLLIFSFLETSSGGTPKGNVLKEWKTELYQWAAQGKPREVRWQEIDAKLETTWANERGAYHMNCASKPSAVSSTYREYRANIYYSKNIDGIYKFLPMKTIDVQSCLSSAVLPSVTIIPVPTTDSGSKVKIQLVMRYTDDSKKVYECMEDKCESFQGKVNTNDPRNDDGYTNGWKEVPKEIPQDGLYQRE